MMKMKTLKDMVDAWSVHSGCYNDSCTDEKPNYCVNSEWLRAAAVEWVKKLETERHKERTDKITMQEFNFLVGEFEGMINWIKHFFNLSESDIR